MRLEIHFTYITRTGLSEQFSSQALIDIKDALKFAEDMKQTGRIENLTFIDQHGVHWTEKQLTELQIDIETEPHEVKLYFDGGFDDVSKESGLGIVVYYKQDNHSYRLRKNALVSELLTNNEAEYAALHLGIQAIIDLGVERLSIDISGDSKLVIHQMNGDWPCYEPTLVKWADRIDALLDEHGITPNYEQILRKHNKEADLLANQAMKGIFIESTKELE